MSRVVAALMTIVMLHASGARGYAACDTHSSSTAPAPMAHHTGDQHGGPSHQESGHESNECDASFAIGCCQALAAPSPANDSVSVGVVAAERAAVDARTLLVLAPDPPPPRA